MIRSKISWEAAEAERNYKLWHIYAVTLATTGTEARIYKDNKDQTFMGKQQLKEIKPFFF